MTNTPIYHAVSDDLRIYPIHMSLTFKTHERFMREHEMGDTAWIDAAWNKPRLRTVARLKKPARKRR